MSSLNDNFGECHCSHDCGFEGPQVCGSNGMFYMNECRMQVAACELNTEITVVKETECAVVTEGNISIHLYICSYLCVSRFENEVGII